MTVSRPMSRLFSGLTLSLAAFSALFLLARCGSNKSALNNSSDVATFSTVYSETLQPACASCHNPSGSAWADSVQLDFSTLSTAYSSLNPGSTRVSANDMVGTCGQVTIVAPSNSGASYILPTLSPSQTNDFVQAGCTPYQHQSVALSDSELADLTSWINSGAPNN